MDLQAVVPELLVEEVERAIDFYGRVLGFRVSFRMPESDKPVVAQLENGAARLMLLAKDFVRAQISNLPDTIAQGGSVIQFPVGTGDAARNAYGALEKEVNVLLPLREVGNGVVEFAFSDPDGNMIVILGQ